MDDTPPDYMDSPPYIITVLVIIILLASSIALAYSKLHAVSYLLSSSSLVLYKAPRQVHYRNYCTRGRVERQI